MGVPFSVCRGDRKRTDYYREVVFLGVFRNTVERLLKLIQNRWKEFCEIQCWGVLLHLSGHLCPYSDQTILTTAYIKIGLRLCSYRERHTINIYWKEKYFEHNLQRSVHHTPRNECNFSASIIISDISYIRWLYKFPLYFTRVFLLCFDNRRADAGRVVNYTKERQLHIVVKSIFW